LLQGVVQFFCEHRKADDGGVGGKGSMQKEKKKRKKKKKKHDRLCFRVGSSSRAWKTDGTSTYMQ